ncbi:hypothetical protein CKO24_02610 [Rhodothalassium salexigens DSM 2132]|nr:hypothetical protein [Rhodothalassium salexigens DSM 2132]
MGRQSSAVAVRGASPTVSRAPRSPKPSRARSSRAPRASRGKGGEGSGGAGAPEPAAPRRPAKRRRPLWRLAYWSVVVGVWAAIAGVGGLVYLAHDLPDLNRLPAPNQKQAIVVKTAGGQTLATYGAVYNDWLSYGEIPEVMVLAILAAEDRRFFDHMGVDPRGVARAALANIRAGALRQGGSTLTQQLAKNLFLTPERSLKRKAQEVMVAFWLERTFAKSELLELYLNRVYFGAGTYGIDAAARTYYGHSARRLSLAEAALLAGLVKAPSAYAPTNDPERAFERASVVLGAMVDAGLITEMAARRARAEPAAIQPSARAGDVRYFTDWVVRRTRALTAETERPLTVYTTLDRQAQAAAERALGGALGTAGPARRVAQGALVALAPDGAVRAMTGGRAYARSEYNRAVQARRQMGSAFKPFVYAAALEAGMGPDTLVDDAPIAVDGWSPENYGRSYRGPVTLSEALSVSLNTATVRLQERVGRDRIVALARRLGVDAPLEPVRSLALGPEEMSLLDITGAYAPFANGGRAAEPYAILEIHALDGELLYRRRALPPEQVLSAEVAQTMATMLENVVEWGTGKRARIDRPAAGKTGTSQGFRDAVFVGFTHDLVAGVWLGNDDDTPTDRVTGGTLPADIWADFMIEAHVGRPVRPLGGGALKATFTGPEAG